jgi:LysR family glycine cleavage system transcriptional activator
MSHLPPLPALRYFEAVARLGSVTSAARELHVTHSAISQQIKVLEDIMDVPLFVRAGRGLTLTEEGRLYALEIRDALRDIEVATRKARARPQEDELVITTLHSLALHWLVSRLPRFRQAHPHYRIRLQTGLELSELQQGMADVGIRMGQGPWPNLAQQLLYKDVALVVASPSFAGGKLPRTPSEVVRCPLLHETDNAWIDWCRAAGVPEPVQPIQFRANDSNISVGCAELGHGLLLTRYSIVADLLEQGRLVQITDIRVPYSYPYWLVWPQRDAMPEKVRDFRTWITAEFEAFSAKVRF